MAEQPELETLRRDLDRDIGGKRIKTVEVPGSGAIPRHTNKKQFVTLGFPDLAAAVAAARTLVPMP